MDPSQAKYRILNRPAEVWWSGFRSTTDRLQQAGWQIAADEDIAYGRIRLMMQHREMKLYALTNSAMFDYYKSRYYDDSKIPLVFEVVQVAPKFEVHRIQEMGTKAWENFRQIDAMPQFSNVEIRTPEDLKIFTTPLVRTEELIVEPQTVAAMLEQIRKMQAPEQARIRARERAAAARESLSIDAQPRQQFHAQIISIDEYRQAA